MRRRSLRPAKQKSFKRIFQGQSPSSNTTFILTHGYESKKWWKNIPTFSWVFPKQRGIFPTFSRQIPWSFTPMQRWKCLEAERGVTRGDFKTDTDISAHSLKTDCYVWKMCCYLWLICLPFFGRHQFWYPNIGISMFILGNFYVVSNVHPTSSHWRKSRHQGERELIDMESHCTTTTIHQPPTALQKVIRDYSSEGKNVIPLIKDFTKTRASTCQTQSQMFL